ncbi:MAG TPA: porin, partial [Opitutaceae bacterium]|nr:porin [Opitutaceae bacterium]
SGAPLRELQNKAWQVNAGYVLTGEKTAYTGLIPQQTFDLDKGTWGAWEVIARYADFKIDQNAFSLYADSATSSRETSAWGVGVNWYLNRVFRFEVDYSHTHFSGAAGSTPTNPLLQQGEDAVITRFQVLF